MNIFLHIKKHQGLLLGALFFLTILGACIYTYLATPIFITHATSSKTHVTEESNILSNKTILLVNTQKGFGGGEIYTLALYDQLIRAGASVIPFVKYNSPLARKFDERSTSYYAIRFPRIGLSSAMSKITGQESIALIHCNIARETIPAKNAVNNSNTLVVLTKHVPEAFSNDITKDLDGLIAVSHQIENEMMSKNNNLNLNIGHIAWIPPFFHEERFKNVMSTENRREFFKDAFDIEIDQTLPIVSNTTNMSRDKNPQLLVHAIAHLKHEKNIFVQAIFAGAGNKLERVKKLAHTLDVGELCFFLGHTENTPGLLANVDIHVLASLKEGLGISLLEAAMLKRPLIATSGTGAMDVVIDGDTGMVVENNNAEAMANAIEYLLDHPELRELYGNAAHQRIQEHFAMKQTTEKILAFYKTVLNI
jgi:glycosyltransferase involved in cell wall biosynthesis